jgi:2'-5' RNA ligase
MTGPSSERARLFVALDLPAAPRDALAQWRGAAIDHVGHLRPVAREFLHATLCFLGWQPSDARDEILVACRAVADGIPAELRVGEALWLPRRRPRVLAVALEDPDGGLGITQAALARALAAGGWYVPEKRPYLAHVTVARVPAGTRLPAAQLPAPPPLRFSASQITLYRSRLGAGGARYESLGTIELGAQSSGVSRPAGAGIPTAGGG